MGTRLYVGNLPFSADEDQIRELFSQKGRTVTEVKLVTDRDTGRPKGFAFVEMPESSAANAAIGGLNGQELNGRPLNVNEAKPKAEGGNRTGNNRPRNSY